MKKIIYLQLALLIFLNLPFVSANTQNNAPNKDLIFLIDLSASMQRDNLIQKVKDVLSTTINSSVAVGDNVTILGFDSQVYLLIDKKINSISDKFALNSIISNIEANGQWTYITHALEIAAQQIEKLMADNSQKLKILYLLTDGKNEPPPNIQNPVTYTELVDKYFKVWTAKNSFTYIFKFGVTERDEEQEEFIDKTGSTVGDLDRLTNISYAALIPQKISKSIIFNNENISDTIRLFAGVSYLREPLVFRLNSSENIETDNASQYSIDSTGQVYDIPLTLKVEDDQSMLRGWLAIDYSQDDAFIIPDTIQIEYSVKRETIEATEEIEEPLEEINLTWLFIILGIVVLVVILFFICKIASPKFPDSVELVISDKKTGTSMGEYALADFNSFCLTSVTIGENQDIDIDIDGCIIKLSPTSSGTKVRIINGEVWEDFEQEDNLHESGNVFHIYPESSLVTITKKMKFDTQDNSDDDDLDESDFNEDNIE